MQTITEQAPRKAARPAVRAGTILEIVSGRAYFELDVEPGGRRGPAIIPISGGPAAATGQRCAVTTLDTGEPLILVRWAS